MSLRKSIQYAANIGHWYKSNDDEVANSRQVAAEQKRAEELKVLTEAANKILESAPAYMHGCARRGEATSHVHTIPEEEIDFPRDYFDGQPLDPGTLKGVSRRVFEILQEEKLDPMIRIPSRHTFHIEIPVLPKNN